MNRFLRVLCILAWPIFAIWAGAIFYLSSLNGHQVEELNIFHLWDKAEHFAAYAAGAFLCAAALRVTTDWRRLSIFLLSVLALAAYGASDEYHQLYTPGRSGADVQDWLADLLGSAAGAALLCLWAYLLRKRGRTGAEVRSLARLRPAR